MAAAASTVPRSMRIDIWSDIVCPWCAIGKAHLDAALARFDPAQDVQVVWRSFELDPGAPAVQPGRYMDLLARKYGTSRDGAEAMIDNMTRRAAAVGLHFNFDIARPGNSFDAHRLVHLGADRGLQGPVKERFLAGYLGEGAAVADPEALARMATEAGLEPAEVRTVLSSDAYADAVRSDEAEAMRLHITGVPFFLVDRRYAIPGAQPPELILATLQRAWEDADRLVTVTGEGAVCGPDGCS